MVQGIGSIRITRPGIYARGGRVGYASGGRTRNTAPLGRSLSDYGSGPEYRYFLPSEAEITNGSSQPVVEPAFSFAVNSRGERAIDTGDNRTGTEGMQFGPEATSWQDFVSRVGTGALFASGPLGLGYGLVSAKNGMPGTMIGDLRGALRSGREAFENAYDGSNGRFGDGWYSDEERALKAAEEAGITWSDNNGGLVEGPRGDYSGVPTNTPSNTNYNDPITVSDLGPPDTGENGGGGGSGNGPDPATGSTEDNSAYDYARGGKVGLSCFADGGEADRPYLDYDRGQNKGRYDIGSRGLGDRANDEKGLYPGLNTRQTAGTMQRQGWMNMVSARGQAAAEALAGIDNEMYEGENDPSLRSDVENFIDEFGEKEWDALRSGQSGGGFASGGPVGIADYAAGGNVNGPGGGTDDLIPAQLSDGEHVATAAEISSLGDGSNNEGQRRMYKLRKLMKTPHGVKKIKSLTSYLRNPKKAK